MLQQQPDFGAGLQYNQHSYLLLEDSTPQSSCIGDLLIKRSSWHITMRVVQRQGYLERNAEGPQGD